jgi:hypothetical protein
MTSIGSIVELPAEWLARTSILPDRCARHGQPAVRRIRLMIKSRSGGPPPLRVDGWPICATCAQAIVVGRTVANTLLWGGLLGLGLGFVQGSLVTVMLGLAAIVGSAVPFWRGSLSRLTPAELSADGTTVLLHEAHPTFADDLRALTR